MEQITITYVVIRQADLRRLVLPISYFLEKPFRNWTKLSSEVVGSIKLFLDFRTPLQRLRNHLDSVLQEPLWNGKLKAMEITDIQHSHRIIEVLVSANTPDELRNLSVKVREDFIQYLIASKSSGYRIFPLEPSGPPTGKNLMSRHRRFRRFMNVWGGASTLSENRTLTSTRSGSFTSPRLCGIEKGDHFRLRDRLLKGDAQLPVGGLQNRCWRNERLPTSCGRGISDNFAWSVARRLVLETFSGSAAKFYLKVTCLVTRCLKRQQR